jgi:hypothetical protein
MAYDRTLRSNGLPSYPMSDSRFADSPVARRMVSL